MSRTIRMKPHHFVDIVTALGQGQTTYTPHPYGHALHKVAASILTAHDRFDLARASDLLTLADDSGLEVDALDGAPGVYTARYAGPGASDEDRYRKLLATLGDIPPEQRTARFRCAVALAHPGRRPTVAEGTCEGVIAYEPQGANGFGYDPVFYLPEFGCTMAQLHPEHKNRISHRARAMRAARPLLDQILAEGGESQDA